MALTWRLPGLTLYDPMARLRSSLAGRGWLWPGSQPKFLGAPQRHFASKEDLRPSVRRFPRLPTVGSRCCARPCELRKRAGRGLVPADSEPRPAIAFPGMRRLGEYKIGHLPPFAAERLKGVVTLTGHGAREAISAARTGSGGDAGPAFHCATALRR